MKKVIAGSIVCVFMIAGCFFGSTLNFTAADAEGKPNIVANPGFENGVYGVYNPNSLPADWMVMRAKNGLSEVSWVDTGASEGDRCLRIKGEKNTVSVISESFAVEPFTAYYNHINLRASRESDDRIECFFIVFDEDGKKLDQDMHVVSIDEDWQKIEFNSAIYNSYARFARIIVTINSTSDRIVWIDDVGSYQVYRFNE